MPTETRETEGPIRLGAMDIVCTRRQRDLYADGLVKARETFLVLIVMARDFRDAEGQAGDLNERGERLTGGAINAMYSVGSRFYETAIGMRSLVDYDWANVELERHGFRNGGYTKRHKPGQVSYVHNRVLTEEDLTRSNDEETAPTP